MNSYNAILCSCICVELKKVIKGGISVSKEKNNIRVIVDHALMGIWVKTIQDLKVDYSPQRKAKIIAEEIVKLYKVTVYSMYFY